MTDRLEALRALLENVEAETFRQSYAMDAFPVRHEHWDEDPAAHTTAAYLGSLDAAKALHEAVLPGWGWRIATCHVSDDAFVFPDFNCPTHGERLLKDLPVLVGGEEWSEHTDVDLRRSGNPARAWLIAILKALIAEAEK